MDFIAIFEILFSLFPAWFAVVLIGAFFAFVLFCLFRFVIWVIEIIPGF